MSVTYIRPKRLQGADRVFFLARWSDEWNRRSAERFIENWQLAADDGRVRHTEMFGAWLRVFASHPRRSPLRRLANRRSRVWRPVSDRVGQRRAVRRYERAVAESAPPQLAHRATWMEVSTQ